MSVSGGSGRRLCVRCKVAYDVPVQLQKLSFVEMSEKGILISQAAAPVGLRQRDGVLYTVHNLVYV